jgi:molecular chaperone HtpG
MAQEVKPFSFKAEIKQLLNILIHSLYTDQEIFLRELVSNASDALNRVRFEMLTEQGVLDPDAELAIRIQADKEARTLTITDTGIGMTRDELAQNLGTIAQSGARAFLEAAKDQQQDAADLIGQFGVGFYSVFMVAESVTVHSRSFKPRAKPASWTASGADTYQLGPSEKSERGTTIEIKLKEDAAEFADEFRLRQIVRKHSDYVSFSIYIGEDEEQVNRQTAIWRSPKQELEDEQYSDFYRQLTLDPQEPLLHLHTVTDAPVRLYAVLFLPAHAERGIFSLRREDGLKLYSRNILIDEYNKALLPEHLRFVQGVVDSEDLPLNVSRETVQATGLMARLQKILTGQVLGALKDLAKKEPEKYVQFWENFGDYLKEGIAADPTTQERLAPLLRFRTNKHPDQWRSFEDYIAGLKDGQKTIYYILGEDQHSILHSPHLEAFEKNDHEVLLFTETLDAFMLMNLKEFEEYTLENIAKADLDLPEDTEEETPGDSEQEETLSEDEFSQLSDLFKQHIGEAVTDVRKTDRLSQSVARLVDPEGAMETQMQRVYRLLDKDFEMPKKVLELNPQHPILHRLKSLDPASDLAKAIVTQIYESALLVEGLHPDPASMAPRIQELIAAALEK